MNTQTESLKAISVEDLLRPFETAEDRNLKSLFNENMQLRDQVAMLEAEVDKQDKIIKLFAELLFLTCGDK
jgi:hypothetical protein